MRIRPLIFLLVSILMLGCESEKRLFWVDSGNDYHVLTENHHHFLVAAEAIKVLRKEEVFSAMKHEVSEMETLHCSGQFELKVYYIAIYGDEENSWLSLRTVDSTGLLIDDLLFSNWPSTSENPFCQSTIYNNLEIVKRCGDLTERWMLNEFGKFEKHENDL